MHVVVWFPRAWGSKELGFAEVHCRGRRLSYRYCPRALVGNKSGSKRSIKLLGRNSYPGTRVPGYAFLLHRAYCPADHRGPKWELLPVLVRVVVLLAELCYRSWIITRVLSSGKLSPPDQNTGGQ
eukprot:1044533-Rhodomonas_salina.3